MVSYNLLNLYFFIPEIILFLLIQILILVKVFGKSVSLLSLYNFVFKLIIFCLFVILFICGFYLYIFFYNETFEIITLGDILVINYFISFIKISIIFLSFIYFFIIYKISLKISDLDIEFNIFILVAIFGMFIMLSANDLLVFFLALECQSFSLYILACWHKNSNYSVEAGIKYFIISSIASCFLLVGISFIYGIFGTLNYSLLNLLTPLSFLYLDSFLESISDVASLLIFNQKTVLKYTYFYEIFENTSEVEIVRLPFVEFGFYNICVSFYNIWISLWFNSLAFSYILGVFFIFISLLLKIGCIPFFTWVPDVYQGVPLTVTLLFLTLPKLVGISVLFILSNLFFKTVFLINLKFYLFFWSGFLSIIIGNIGALRQKNIKRILAYGSITHVGFLLVLLAFNNFWMNLIVVCYFLIYLFILFNFFFLILCLQKQTSGFFINNIWELQNLYKSNPTLCWMLVIILSSFGGIPPFAGFFIKFLVFKVLILSNFFLSAFFLMLISIIGIYYYIRFIKILFFDQNTKFLFLTNINYSVAFFSSNFILFNIFMIVFLGQYFVFWI